MVSPRHAANARSAAPAPAPASASASAPTSSSGRPGYRPELHGLRGLAIGLVVVYHVWFDRVSGGVDVFLFLSAYFLTGTFVRRMESGRPMAPLAYWARTFKRLLPPATLVILGTLAAAALLLPPSTWMPAIHDGLGSLLQVQNWVLIHRDADYDAATGITTSLLQHFWSLSIQGQAFLLWPLLFALCAVIARRLRRSPRAVVAVVFGALALMSFAWSVHSTATQQETAYFDTGTRLWEFAAGTLLALVPALTLPRRLRLVLGWAGLAVLVATGAVLDVQSMFPGWIALIPLLGAALVVLAGSTASPYGAERVLTARPVALLGDVSYALYLVHWPLLTLMLLRSDRESAGAVGGLLIIVASLVLAYALTRWVDTPVRRWTWVNASALRSAAAVLVVLVLGLAPTLAAQVRLDRIQDEALARADVDNPGAQVLHPDFTPPAEADDTAETLPLEAALRDDRIDLPEECSGEFAPEDPSVAEHCSSTAAPDDAKVMVAVGSSRLGQAAVSLIDPAEANGWRIIVIRRPSCQFVPGTMTYAGQECFDHNLAALEYLHDLEPDAVVLNTTSYRGNDPESVSEAVEESVPDLLDQGTELIALRTLPRVPEDPLDCFEGDGTEEDCAQPLDPEHMPSQRADADDLEQLAEHGRVHDVDLTEHICPEHECPVQIGNVFVFYDTDHVTATYMQTLGDEADRQLAESGFRW